MAFAIPSSSNRTDQFPVYGFRLAYPIAGDRFLHQFHISAVIPPSSYTHQMAFLPTFFGSYLSGILSSDWCYHAVRFNSIQTRTPSLGQVFPPCSRPPSSIDTGSTCHWLDLHCYYGFLRLLITHCSGFPIRLYLGYLYPLS
jgi:hypothetical protein